MSDAPAPPPTAESPPAAAAQPTPPSETTVVPAASPPSDPTSRPKKSRRPLVITAIVVGIVLLVLGGTFVYLVSPPARAEFNDPVSADTRSTNAALYAALVAAGIPDPFVDTNDARAYVAYTLPNVSLAQADTYQRFVIGSAADASPSSEYIYAFQYVDKDPKQLWIVKMSDFLDYVAGSLSAADLEARIQKVSF